MKTQKFFHLTFEMTNFNHTFGRNVLEDLLNNLFPITWGHNKHGKDLADAMLEQHPNIKFIGLFSDTNEPHADEAGKLNISKFMIKWLK